MTQIDRANLEGERPDGGPKWCVFPCQKLDDDGNKIDRQCRVSVDPRYAGNVWQWSGTPDAPTLTPSVDCQSQPNCWHGFIVEGKVLP